MLMRTDPFRELDRLTQQLTGGSTAGTWSRPNPMPMDAYRSGDEYVVVFDEFFNFPGWRLHALHSKPRRHAIAVNGPWRITFEWKNGDALRARRRNSTPPAGARTNCAPKASRPWTPSSMSNLRQRAAIS